MDERTDASAAFALRLAADIVTALVVAGVLSKEAASKLVDDALNAGLASYPEHETMFREIASVIDTQTGLAKVEFDRLSKDG